MILFNQTISPGAEVVRADLDDPSTLLEAVSGCHGVFGVTNIWEHNSKAKEIEQVWSNYERTKIKFKKHNRSRGNPQFSGDLFYSNDILKTLGKHVFNDLNDTLHFEENAGQ